MIVMLLRLIWAALVGIVSFAWLLPIWHFVWCIGFDKQKWAYSHDENYDHYWAKCNICGWFRETNFLEAGSKRSLRRKH